MTSITPIDHVTEGLSEVTSYFTSKEDFLSFLESFLVPLQELSDALLDLTKIKDLDTVTGIWLDYIGKIVGEDRAGRGDSVYRKALQLRVSINNADGTAPITWNIIKSYTDSDYVRLQAGILSYGQIIFNGRTNADLTLWNLVQDIIPITVYNTLMQDTDDKCFFPSYEWVVSEIELLELVLDDGTTETLDVLLTPTGSDLVPIYISPNGNSSIEDPDSIGSQYLGWEEPSEFRLSDDNTFALSINGELKTFMTNSEGANDDVLLPWEIDETCIVEYLGPTYDELFSYYGDQLSGTLDAIPPVYEALPDRFN